MSVTIRLARFGQKKRPFYRIVVSERQSRRDGGFIEYLGTYNPMTEPSTITLDDERVKRWVGVGAQTSPLVGKIIKNRIPGLLEDREAHQRKKIQERRKKRKERAKASAA